ncbi:metabotropic glutamate receptor 2-like [Engystomops pustulosus]|uniref:metabotropic glutamate receptor 2-like n=1 Tax=Engystomops pustulosus TaxID=76066 RepID=UPI003AFA6882
MFDDRWFVQRTGTAMGTFANLFLACLENRCIFSLDNPFVSNMKAFLRYVDDIFIVWEGTRTQFFNFVEYLNTTNQMNMRFTAVYGEKELDFLDVKGREIGNELCTSAFRKSTATNSFLHFDSFHPTHTKTSLPYSQFLRLRRINSTHTQFFCQAEDLTKRLLARGYPKNILQEAYQKVIALSQEALLVGGRGRRGRRGHGETVSGNKKFALSFEYSLCEGIIRQASRSSLAEKFLSIQSPDLSFHVMAALSWTLLSLVVLCSKGENISGGEPSKSVLEIAGLFPVRDECYGSYRMYIKRSKLYESVQLMEAMKFTIEEINRNSTFLPEIKLVSSPKVLCRYHRIQQEVNNTMKSNTIAAVIETADDFISDKILDSLRGSEIPVIGCSATALKQDKRPYLLRMMPPDQYQIKAIIDLLIHYNWTYVSIVASSDPTFISVMEEFKRKAERHNICIATSVVMCYREDYTQDIMNLQKHSRARVVVLIVNLKDLEHLLSVALRHNASYTWVVNTTWGSTEKIVEKYHKAVGRVIGVDTQSYPLPRINKHFMRFYDKLEMETIRASLLKVIRREQQKVRRNKEVKEKFRSSPKIQSVVNAVYAIAHALQNMSSSTCPNMSADCVRENNDTFMTFLRKTRFTAPFRPPDVQYTVRFDEDGYGPARYNIFTIQEIHGRHQYQQIGSWAEKLTLNTSHSMWESNTVPESHCGKTCGKHQVKKFDQGNPCCWDCTECLPNRIVINETTCKACEPGHWPNKDHNNCSKLPVHYIQWGNGLAIGSLCFSGLGILSTVFVGGVLLWNNNTPIVKASGREFCYILLSGVLLLYIMTFIFIARPSVVICGLRRLGLATSFAICYSALLTKTNRITRIFTSAQKGIAPPRYINLASQLSICLALITCQILGLVIWLIVDPAEVIESVSSDKLYMILKCKSGDIRIFLCLVYNVLLILLCTVYAFKTREYPENFNEAKCIGFTMYTTCIIWLFSVPVFYVTSDHPKVQVTALCASISLCALVILGGLFVPKLYIIFCHPEKNVVSHFTPTSLPPQALPLWR